MCILLALITYVYHNARLKKNVKFPRATLHKGDSYGCSHCHWSCSFTWCGIALKAPYQFNCTALPLRSCLQCVINVTASVYPAAYGPCVRRIQSPDGLGRHFFCDRKHMKILYQEPPRRKDHLCSLRL